MKLAQTSTKHWKWPYQECRKKPGNRVWGRTQAWARAYWGAAGAEPAGSLALDCIVPGDTAPSHCAPMLGRWPTPHLPLPDHPKSVQDVSEKLQSKILQISTVIPFLIWCMWMFHLNNFQDKIHFKIKGQHCSAPNSLVCLQTTSVPTEPGQGFSLSVVKSWAGLMGSNLSH